MAKHTHGAKSRSKASAKVKKPLISIGRAYPLGIINFDKPLEVHLGEARFYSTYGGVRHTPLYVPTGLQRIECFILRVNHPYTYWNQLRKKIQAARLIPASLYQAAPFVKKYREMLQKRLAKGRTIILPGHHWSEEAHSRTGLADHNDVYSTIRCLRGVLEPAAEAVDYLDDGCLILAYRRLRISEKEEAKFSE